MDDLISRQAAIDAIDKEQKEIGVSDASAIYECSRFKTIIKRLPTAQPEPCEDAVSRKDMLAELDEWREAFDENGHKESCSDMKLVRKFMALLPSAQPERKRGKWVFKNDLVTVPNGYWECSECKEGRLLYEENFCPHCGADLRTAAQIVHDAIDNTPMAEDAYPGIKERLHKAVDDMREVTNGN